MGCLPCSVMRNVLVGFVPILSHYYTISYRTIALELLASMNKENPEPMAEEDKVEFVDLIKSMKFTLGVSIARDVLAIAALAATITLTVLSILHLPTTLVIGLGIGLGVLLIASLALSVRTLLAVNTYSKTLDTFPIQGQDGSDSDIE